MLNTLFDNKADRAIDRIKKHEPPEGYYLAFSGGKDSVVILDLAKRADVKFQAHYNNTTVDPPELVQFIRTFPEVIISQPEISMWKLIIKKRMPPTRRVRYCCEYLKECHGGGQVIITGIRAEESGSRAKRKIYENDYKDKSKWFLTPIIDWNMHDIWEYIETRMLCYCKLYDEGYDRLGCIMCPFQHSKKQLMDAERWPKYYEAYLRAFQRCIDKRKADGMKTSWNTGLDMMKWWLEGKLP